MQTVMARGRSIPVEMRRLAFNPRREAEALFKKPANSNAPHTLEDVSKESIEAAVANLLPPEPPVTPITPAEETPHQKVFRLVGERKFEEAARLAKRLIDSGDVDGFFIYGGTPTYRKADIVVSDKVKASRKGAFSEIINITPEIAQRILSRNPGNRKIVIRPGGGLVARLRDISEGRWRLNGQNIVMSREGDLNDGQHRLWAVLLSGVHVRTSVFFGAERDSRLTLDTNEPRSGAARLDFLDVPYSALASATVTLVHKIEHGREATAAEKVQVYLDDEKTFQAAIKAVGNQPKGTPKASFASAAYFLVRAGAPLGLIENFMAEVRGTAKVVKQKSPGVALREAILAKAFKGTQADLTFTVIDLYGQWRRGKRAFNVAIVNKMPELVTF